MSNDYTFKFTDPLKTADTFVVKPYTFNGHLSPADPALYTNPDTSITAVSANTSLVFLGKGMPDYGEAVQNNLIYLTEHFANSTPPLEPTEGQIWYKNDTSELYIYNGTTWYNVAVPGAGDLDLNGNNIINLGGIGVGFNAVNETDLVLAINTHASDLSLHLTPSQNVLLDGLSPTLTSAELNYVEGVTSDIQTQLDAKVNHDGSVAMTGSLDMGSNFIINLAYPSNPTDAASKQYVLDVVTLAGADGVVNAGTLNPLTGELTLGRTVGGPVLVSGMFAPWVHTQADDTVTHDVATPVNQSFITEYAIGVGSYPTPPVHDTFRYLDQAIYELRRPVRRQLIVSTGVTTINFDSSMAYDVGTNKMQIFVNGVKQYANERGMSTITLTNFVIGLTSDTGLALSTLYSFNITVDGGSPIPVSITTPAVGPYKYSDLMADITNAMLLAVVPATVVLQQYLDRMEIVFYSTSTGSGSSVVISYSGGELFTSMPDASSPVGVSIVTDYAYEEVGAVGETSTQVVFATAPSIGAVLEVLVW